jgi:hypothetical protein
MVFQRERLGCRRSSPFLASRINHNELNELQQQRSGRRYGCPGKEKLGNRTPGATDGLWVISRDTLEGKAAQTLK